ncbi:MAG: threonine/serine dehydratase [Clostridiales bacterium]|nr:threonine/serine dehydratase [Candidatus Crickella equi]
MSTVTYNDVLAARERIREYIELTPLQESKYLGDDNHHYFFKLECQQKLNSFKLRGSLARMSLMTDSEKKQGVGTVSSGNNGCAVSYVARILGIDNVVIIVPKCTPKKKINTIQELGGNVLIMGENYDEAHELGQKYIREHNMHMIDADEDPEIYAGLGSIGLEILEQNPKIDTIAVPIGGGAICAGIALAAKTVKPGIRVIGVQTSACPSMIEAIKNNEWYENYPTDGESICESLVGGIGNLAFEMHKDLIDGYVAVDEKDIRKAVAHMYKNEGFLAEGGASTVVAAAMAKPEELGGTNIALVVTGGNIDKELLDTILNEEA